MVSVMNRKIFCCDRMEFNSKGNVHILLKYFSDDDSYGITWMHHGSGVITIPFCPWCGAEIAFVSDYDHMISLKDTMELYKEDGDMTSFNTAETEYIKFCNEYIKENPKQTNIFSQQETEKYRGQHANCDNCEELSLFLKDGDEEGATSIIYIPNTRTYAILNQKKYGGFEAMDYCPFCGAKFTERLDEELTNILRSEYGLDSWKDYKRAPQEFHTDEWWKKRGL
jgi:hypothetical protein